MRWHRRRLEASGRAEIEAQRAEVAALAAAAAEAQKEAGEREGDIARLRAQRERQSDGRVRELGARADELSKKCALARSPACGGAFAGFASRGAVRCPATSSLPALLLLSLGDHAIQ
jgi:hypothetical protein